MDIKVYYQNVRGMKTKLKDIYNEILVNSYDIILFTESWLNKSVLDGEICDLNNYFLYRRDRDNPDKAEGGGVMILINNRLKSKIQTSWVSEAEDLWVTLCLHNNIKVHLCVVYIPPSSNHS